MDETVKRGAKLLDEIVPGWHRKVNLEKLDMSSGCTCMLGQLFGHNVETSIAMEMYPELWTKYRNTSSGYAIGRAMIPRLRKVNPVPMDDGSLLGYRYDRQQEMWIYNSDIADESFLATACAGSNNKCDWAIEIADRLAADEQQSTNSPRTVQEEVKDGHV